MQRPAVVAAFSAVAAVVLFAAPAAADSAPTPPPGSLNVQPAGVTTSGQPGAYHCGVAASAGGNGYSVQPQQVSSSGSGSPTGCDTGGSPSGGTQTSSSGQGTSSGRSAQGQAATKQTTGGEAAPAASLHGAGGFLGGPLWIGLLLLLALFLLLIGFALGRRRPARAIA